MSELDPNARAYTVAECEAEIEWHAKAVALAKRAGATDYESPYIERWQRTLATAREAERLREYATHKYGCPGCPDGGAIKSCTCGLTAILTAHGAKE